VIGQRTVGSRNSRVLRNTCGLAVLLAALLPSAAQAFGVASFRAETLNADGTTLATQAGGHPYYGVTSFSLNSSGGLPDGDLKNVRVDVPAGLIPNPEAVPKCTQPMPSLCPPDTQVGTVDIVAVLRPLPAPLALPPLPVYNMTPPAGKVSDFAFGIPLVNPRVDIIGGVRDTSDYGVYFTISDLAATPSVLSNTLTFWGVPADHGTGAPRKPFLTNPTVCGPPPTTHLTIEDHSGNTATASDTTASGATGCDQVPFDPTVTVTPGTTKRDSPTGGSVDIHVPQFLNPDGIESSHVKDTHVTLPAGATINPSAANGLQACSDAQLAKGTHDPVGCPDASKIGSVEITSPALSAPLTGSVWVGSQLADDPYRIFLQATGPMGLDVRLKGSVVPDPTTGRLTATFADTPQVPFTDFELTLNGGPHATLATPLACGAAVTSSSLVPYSGGAPGTSTSTFDVDADGAGGACPAATPFSPAFSATTTSPQAGGDTGFTVDVSRDDGQQTLGAIQLTEPPGFTGRIPAVPRCAEAQAAAGTCPDASRIGTTTVAAGAGSDPFKISGPVYLTGPYKGAPYGLSVVVHAIAGPYDLGTVVVRAAIRVDRNDAHLTVDSDPLPTILKGIPLRLRHVNVTIDRHGFLLNPTACGPHDIASSLRSVDGASVTPGSRFTISGCDKLKFTPTITASTSGRPTRNRGGSLLVTLKQPAGQMNMKRVSVQLPKPFSAQGRTTALACLDTVFNVDPDKCGAVSKVGTAEATSPTLPTALTGNAWLVGHNARLPTLEVRLNGSGVELRQSAIIKYGTGYASTFGQVPDVPVSSFRINVPQGAHALLGIAGSICNKRYSMPVNYTGQDGRVRVQIVRLKVDDCPVIVTGARSLRGHRALLTIKTPLAGRLTVTGSGIGGVKRTVRKAGISHVTVKLSKTGARRLAASRKHVLKLNAVARFAPNKVRSSSGASATRSRATRPVTIR